jgi:ATP-binding cassette subfamily F protein uup
VLVCPYPLMAMNLLSAENLSKSYSDKWLFRNISLGISQGDKIALLGQNGSGKTSLLNILAGIHPAEEGLVSYRKGISIGYLSQQPQLDDQLTVLDTLFAGNNPVLLALREYEHQLQRQDEAALTRAIEAMEQLKAWDFEARIKQILGQLGMHDFDKQVGTLSGGQRKRVALAKLLIDEPDLLLLDEPTNHLDLDTIEWLENLLSSESRSLLMVTHDRYFLDKVCNGILALEGGKLARYKGNYGYYLEKKAEKEAIQQSELEKNRNLYKRELEWIRRQPKARGTKAQYRVDAFEELKDKVTQKKNDANLELSVKMSRQGSKILELENLGKAFGNQILVKDFSYTFKKKDRIGIVGKNGMGKSTFLNLLTGRLSPDTGQVSAGETTAFGYYTQAELSFKEGQRVIDLVKEVAEVITLASGETLSASQFLQLFLFPPPIQYTPIEKLSGGEKRRLQLLQVLVRNPNFLILDEPTNDLDLDTLNVLEDFLLHFGGCLLLVSHDRYFMDRLVDQLFVFEGQGNIRTVNGNYSDYRNQLEEEQRKQVRQSEQKPVQATSLPEPKHKLSFKEQKEYEALEKEIEILEQQKSLLISKLNAGSSNHEEITTWAREIETLEQLLSQKSDRWIELAELA